MKIWGTAAAQRAALPVTIRKRADKLLASILVDDSAAPAAADQVHGSERVIGSRRRLRRSRPRHAAPPERFGVTLARALSWARFTNRSAARAG